MGRTLCPRHGSTGIAFVCVHVADAVRAREPISTRIAEVDLAIDSDDPELAIVEHALCAACWDAADRRFHLREAHESELRELPDGATCPRCLDEVAVPSGLPSFRIVLRDEA
jgi:hypothetical protein